MADARKRGRDDAKSAGYIRAPKKKFYRQRAHANVFSDHRIEYPIRPADMDWAAVYGNDDAAPVEIADVGCGYGGLLQGLAPLFPDTRIIGMEIRVQVAEYLRGRIVNAQHDFAEGRREQVPGGFRNISVLRTNAMKFLPNYFTKGQLSKMFFCFPDPHFKVRKHKARIITRPLLAEYAYCLRPGGILYTITDVEDLHQWMARHCDAHPLFRRLAQPELDADPCVEVMTNETEEGKHVTRLGRSKYIACYERLADPVSLP